MANPGAALIKALVQRMQQKAIAVPQASLDEIPTTTPSPVDTPMGTGMLQKTVEKLENQLSAGETTPTAGFEDIVGLHVATDPRRAKEAIIGGKPNPRQQMFEKGVTSESLRGDPTMEEVLGFTESRAMKAPEQAFEGLPSKKMLEGWDSPDGTHHPGIEELVQRGWDEEEAIKVVRKALTAFLDPKPGKRIDTKYAARPATIQKKKGRQYYSKKEIREGDLSKSPGNVERTDPPIKVFGEEQTKVKTADEIPGVDELALKSQVSVVPEGRNIPTKQLPTGAAKGAGRVDIEKSKQSPQPISRDDDIVTSREMANELSVESDPNVIRRMQDLDIMGAEHDKMLNDVRSMYEQWLKQTKQKPDIEAHREILEDFTKRVTTAKEADILMEQYGKGKPRVEGEEFTPLTVENLKQTVIQGPRTAEDVTRGRVTGQPITQEEIQAFLGNVNREIASPISRTASQVGRATKQAPTVPKNMENWPRPDPEKLANLIDELLYGSVGQGERQATTLNQLRELYKQARASGDNRLLQAIEAAAAQVKRGGGLGRQTVESQVAKPKLTQGPSRTMDELSRQRRIGARQGPTDPQQSEMFALERYLQETAESSKAQPTTGTRKAPTMPPEKLVETMNLLDEIEKLLGMPRSPTALPKKPLGSRRRLSNEELVDFLDDPDDFY